MSRSERYIPRSDEQLERIRRAREAAEQFDRDRLKRLEAALKRVKKAELVELMLRAAQEEKAVEWLVENEIELEKPIDLLVHDIKVTIDIATKVDERRLNHNFNYDSRAYEATERGLCQLVQKNAIEEAKGLALRLIAKGSYQMECSDEGMMQDEIESCLQPVIAAVAESPGAREWALEMLHRDRVQFLCTRELKELADSVRQR
ncbi:MAG: hypothetical protein ACQESR_27120 [Planctomycetota bacterium]